MKGGPPPRPIRYRHIAPGGRRETVLDFRNSDPLPARPDRVKCDFCLDQAGMLWCYESRPVILVASWKDRPLRMVDLTEAPQWRACLGCNVYVRYRGLKQSTIDHGAEALARHVYAANPEALLPPIAGLISLYSGILASLTNEPAIEWRSGDVFPPGRPN